MQNSDQFSSEVSSCRVQSGFLDSFPFDPANLNSEVNQVKELKNGRLAMVRQSVSHMTSPYVHACTVLLGRSFPNLAPGNPAEER